MTTYYAGAGGNDGSAGTSWGARKLTIQAALNLATSAGDIVYVGPGTYRESLTMSSSGSVGNVVSLIGDYTGANTDGVGGLVRVTRATNETGSHAAASACLVVTGSYVTVSGILFDRGTSTSGSVQVTNVSNVTLSQCAFSVSAGSSVIAVEITGASQSTVIVERCLFRGYMLYGVRASHSSTVDNAAHVVRNCIFDGVGSIAVGATRVGGWSVKNCLFVNCATGVRVVTALTVGQTLTVNNCAFDGISGTALQATTSAEFVENYNSLFNTSTARSNVSAGANSVAYPFGHDYRPAFEAMFGGTLVTIWDLPSYSGLVELNSGTGAPSTDWRGHAVAGSFREWGAAEYVSTYGIEAGGGVTMWPLSSSFIGTILGAQ